MKRIVFLPPLNDRDYRDTFKVVDVIFDRYIPTSCPSTHLPRTITYENPPFVVQSASGMWFLVSVFAL